MSAAGSWHDLSWGGCSHEFIGSGNSSASGFTEEDATTHSSHPNSFARPLQHHMPYQTQIWKNFIGCHKSRRLVKSCTMASALCVWEVYLLAPGEMWLCWGWRFSPCHPPVPGHTATPGNDNRAVRPCSPLWETSIWFIQCSLSVFYVRCLALVSIWSSSSATDLEEVGKTRMAFFPQLRDPTCLRNFPLLLY